MNFFRTSLNGRPMNITSHNTLDSLNAATFDIMTNMNAMDHMIQSCTDSSVTISKVVALLFSKILAGAPSYIDVLEYWSIIFIVYVRCCLQCSHFTSVNSLLCLWCIPLIYNIINNNNVIEGIMKVKLYYVWYCYVCITLLLCLLSSLPSKCRVWSALCVHTLNSLKVLQQDEQTGKLPRMEVITDAGVWELL